MAWKLRRKNTLREAKIKTLQLAVAYIYNFEDISYESEKEEDARKISMEMRRLAETLRRRIVKLGGDFNQYMGHDDKEGLCG